MFIAEMFFAISAALLVIALILWDAPASFSGAISHAFAALFMFLAFYFWVFAPTATTSVIAASTNASAMGNVITTATITSVGSSVLFNSTGFIILGSATAIYIVLMSVMMIREFVKRGYNQVSK